VKKTKFSLLTNDFCPIQNNPQCNPRIHRRVVKRPILRTVFPEFPNIYLRRDIKSVSELQGQWIRNWSRISSAGITSKLGAGKPRSGVKRFFSSV
jgi:hypothetical protein